MVGLIERDEVKAGAGSVFIRAADAVAAGAVAAEEHLGSVAGGAF